MDMDVALSHNRSDLPFVLDDASIGHQGEPAALVVIVDAPARGPGFACGEKLALESVLAADQPSIDRAASRQLTIERRACGTVFSISEMR